MDFSSANTTLWQIIIQGGFLCLLLLTGNILRRKVTWLRRSLLPTAVIGGFIGLALRHFGILPLDTGFLESVTYHMIAVGFIALGLRVPRATKEQRKSGAFKTGTRTGMFIVSNYLIQGVLGLGVMIALAATFMPGLFRAAGLLLPLGFGQGPGQANNIGNMYETTYGFIGGNTFGLAIATMGFLWACFGGIIYLNSLVRRGRFQWKTSDAQQDQITEPCADEGEIPLVEAVDKFTIQVAMVAGIYFLTYLVSVGFIGLFDVIPGLSGLKATVSPLIWGFNFLIGSSLALGFRNLFSVLRKTKLMTRQYPNSYLLNRIAGTAFDVMIVAAISTIDIGDLSGLWIPFLLITSIGGTVTFLYCRFMAKRLYPEYPVEGLISMYGMMTGTVSTAILLLREVDPTFRTPAAHNLVIGSSVAILIGFPILIMIGLAPQSTAMLWLTVALTTAYAVLLNVILLRNTRIRK